MDGNRGAKGSIKDRLISMLYRIRYAKKVKKEEEYEIAKKEKQVEYLQRLIDLKENENVNVLDSKDKKELEKIKFTATYKFSDNGFKLTKMKRKEVPMFRRTMGIVFQDFRLIPTMNVFDNVAFAMHVVGATRQEIRKDVSRCLNLVGLAEKARCKPAELSGGEQQRVGLARALVNKPNLIIADEPTGNVDPNMSYEIVELLTEINRRGTTILMVTHEHQLVRDFGQRVIMIENGRIVADNANGGLI
jgi:cell division transport system ATP-binding protein